MDRHGKVGFSEDYAKKVTRDEFIANHEQAFPHLDLGAEHDKIVGKASKDELKKVALKKAAKK